MKSTIRSVVIDSGENGLKIDKADEDGITICETEFGRETENQVYIYNSEIKKLIDGLQEILNK